MQSFSSSIHVHTTIWMYHMDADLEHRELHDNGNNTRRLRALLNKSWKQYPTKQQLYCYQPPISKTIQIRRTRHMEHCWRSNGELISDVLLWTPSHGWAGVGQPTRTYLQRPCADTGDGLEDVWEWRMIERNDERESRKSAQAAWHDNAAADDDYHKRCKITDFQDIIMLVKISLAALVEGDPKASFSIATTPRCRGGCYSIPRIFPLYPWSSPYSAEYEARWHQVPIFESLVWLDQRIEPQPPDHWRTLYSLNHVFNKST